MVLQRPSGFIEACRSFSSSTANARRAIGTLIPKKLLDLFGRTSWPLLPADNAARTASKGPKLDIGARMRGMWR